MINIGGRYLNKYTSRNWDKRYFNNNSDKYQQFVYNDNPTVTYLINSSGDLVRRVNQEGGQTSTTDDFDTFESSASVNSTTYQSAY